MLVGAGVARCNCCCKSPLQSLLVGASIAAAIAAAVGAKTVAAAVGAGCVDLAADKEVQSLRGMYQLANNAIITYTKRKLTQYAN